MWWAILGAAAACYAIKAAGLAVPRRVLASPRVRRVAALLPVALLAALVATQTVGDGARLVVDVRLVALGVAAGAVLLRAPFLLVVALAAAVAATLRVL